MQPLAASFVIIEETIIGFYASRAASSQKTISGLLAAGWTGGGSGGWPGCCYYQQRANQVKAATVARGYDDASGAIGAGTTFSPQDNPLHCVVSLVRASKGTTVKMTWTAVEAGGQQNYKLLDREVELNGNQSTVDAYLQLPDPWPTGSYKVDIYLDGRLDRTLNFTIIEAVRTGIGQDFWKI